MSSQKEKYAVGLDIGTTKIVVMVGRLNEYNKIEVLGLGKTKSFGVKRGVVTHITQTIESIIEASRQAEEQSGVEITDMVVGIAGQHIRSIQNSDYITRADSDEVINYQDLERLTNQVKTISLNPGEEIIHVLPQEYKVNNESEISEPIGMFGGRLEANFHIVVGQIASIKNIGRCVKSAGYNLAGLTLEPLASAQAVLSDEEKEAGVVLIDIGGGTTDIAIFKDGIIRHTAVIPYGGNVITEDIKIACSIIDRQAEALKVKYGSAWPGENSDNDIVTITGIRGSRNKKISFKQLSRVISARVKEIMQHVQLEVKKYGHDEQKKRLIAGVVLTGGGSQLNHIRQLAEFVLGMECRVGMPNEHLATGAHNEEVLEDPIYATSVGLLMNALEMESKKVYPKVQQEKQPEQLQLDEVIEEEEEQPVEKMAKKKSNFFENWMEQFRTKMNSTE